MSFAMNVAEILRTLELLEKYDFTPNDRKEEAL